MNSRLANKGRKNWEDEKDFQKRKGNCQKVVELLESYKNNPNKLRIELRVLFGFVGKSFFFSVNLFHCFNILTYCSS